MPWSPHTTPKDSKDYLDRTEREWESGESAKYVIRVNDGRDDHGGFVGLTGLELEWDRQTATHWIWLRKSFWGHGFNGESALALIEVALDHLDLELFAVTHGVENEQSRKAIEKYIETAGGQRDGLLRNWIPYEGRVSDEIRYTVTREQWRSGTD